MMKVLVASASEHGSTAEIANEIGVQLASRGFDVTVAAPEDVGPLEGFDAAVVGSAVYAGHWRAAAVHVARRAAAEMPGRTIWLFSSGPVGDPSRKLVQQMGSDPAEIPSLMATTHSREHRMFAGKLDAQQLRGFQRASLWVFRNLSGDFRDWAAIRPP
jgi:menaquinone-dependent protoporphyrinogen oxidase